MAGVIATVAAGRWHAPRLLAGDPHAAGAPLPAAERGSGDPPPTHAWFVAYRGAVAVAVLVENGSSGGAVAAPLAARFPRALGGAA